eukprot:CAMPEP_0198265984 /NCGR_PEP_ID=MMETSP1447-20131203/25871_1 /TAXON_ID=420782 /ORGANISM="Chaetoceros dichaeta, Strain CCMP1751" /LENGTH=209 /DNA_ID=CAMNT_0043955807 /DNA_START=121 /DNA_END=750 /DNA_ORIENTATION=+
MSNNPPPPALLLVAILYILQCSAVSSFATNRPFLLPRVLPTTTTTRVTTTFHAPSPSLSSSSSSLSLSSSSSSEQTPLIDLQTFLKLTNLVQTGGEAKFKIQNGDCLLNNQIESRRSKKLFTGDVVSLTSDGSSSTQQQQPLDVATEVAKRGYVYKVKGKKIKPVAQIDEFGNKEFGGRFRSDDWRAERKVKKEDRKMKNKRQVLKNED